MLYIDLLEQRVLLAVTPDPYEQYMLYLINRARANPLAEVARYRIALNEGVPADKLISTNPKPPLAVNLALQQAARGHAQWMVDNDVYDHIGEGGSTQFDRNTTAGYAFVAPASWGENIGYAGQKLVPPPVDAIDRMHRNFIVDAGIPDRSHRTNMLSDTFREVGVGLAGGEFVSPTGTNQVWMITQDFAVTPGNAYITGVVFADTRKANHLFEPLEGFGNVDVTATSAGGESYSTTTWSSGGYSLRVPPGTYRVVFSGGNLVTPVERDDVVVGTENVLQDVDATGMPAPKLSKTGTLQVNGSAGDDEIALENLGNTIRIRLNTANWEFLTRDVKRIEVRGGDGNDVIDIGASLPAAKLYGENGHDTLTGGDGKDTIYGGAGDDRLGGRLGNDLIYGESGADRIFGNEDNDRLYGGTGNDVIYGGAGNDRAYGDDGDDSLLGEDGNDTLYGKAGNDTVEGNAGNDTLYGDAGDDRVEGQDGDDRITGGSGADTLAGGIGANTISAKDRAADTVVTSGGIDRITRDTLLDVVTPEVL